MSPGPRALILDPGLIAPGGHHLDYDLRIAGELKARGIDAHLYAHADVQPAVLERLRPVVPVTPLFRASPYTATVPVPAGGGPRARHAADARATAEDLAGLPAAAGATHWIWPSLYAAQLEACARHAPAAAIAACIHVEPDFRDPAGTDRWREAFAAACPIGARVQVGVMVPTLQAAYGPLAGDVPIGLLPIGHDGFPPAAPRSRLRRIGFFGLQRGGKGAAIVPSLAAALAGAGYEVVVHDSGGHLDAGPRIPGVTRLDYVPDLPAAIARCDLVVAPYDPVAYRTKGSGIAWEAVASGVPVVVPAGTAPGSWIASLGAGVLFREYSAGAVLDAVRLAADGYAGIAAAAFAAARGWPGRHGTGPLVSALLAVRSPGRTPAAQG